MEYRSPLDNVFNFISGLPQGHDKPVKHAVYNALALFALFLCCAASYALYVILGPFIKPLIWALLVGSVLHPFKWSLSKRFRSWFNAMEEARTPIFIGIFIVPVNIVNDLSEFIGSNILKYIKYIVTIAIIIPMLHIIYYYTPRICIAIFWKLASYNHCLISFIIDYSTTTTISIILIGYTSIMFVMWSPKNNNKFHLASIGVWLLISCFIAHQFGLSFQTPIFIFLQLVFLAGFAYEVHIIQEEINTNDQQFTFLETILIAFHSKNSTETKEVKEDNVLEEVKKITSDIPKEDESSLKLKPITTSGSFVKITEQDLSIKKENSLPSTPKKKDPWSLELFERTEANITPKKSAVDDAKSNTPVLTNKMKMGVIKEPPASFESSEVCSKQSQRDASTLKFRRSYSQPYVSGLRSRSGLFNFRKPNYIRSTSKSSKDSQSATSDFYLYSLLWGCGVMLFWKNSMMLPILIIPILIYTVKHLGVYLGLWNWLYGYFVKILEGISNWCIERYDALVPVPVRGLYKVVYKVNEHVRVNLKDSIDTVASCVVILGLLIFVLCASIFIAIQIYAEAIMLVQMTSNLINQTVVHNPELRQLLPPAFDDTIDSILDNAYQYGREGISKVVRGMMTDVESAKSAKLEKQVLELWDRLYQTWMAADDAHGPKVTPNAVQNSWDAFIDDIQKSPEMFNIQGITEFVKQNIGTFMSLLESVWSILKGNISLVLGSFSAFVSVLLGGGTAVLNFILNVIVFLTTLFYLLSSSGDLYRPVELMTNFSPSGNRFGLALEGAISGVFTATFKMAAFYGLWTWFIHNWFSVKIVYLPSALATILGAVPFLGTYWACFPAVLDLWLAQGKSFQAILFAIFQFLPTSVVDTTIYNEIQGGGHPYLTGLAIAGGIFCLGVEGAIIGPLLLCALYVAMDLSSSLFRESPTEESLNIPSLSRLEIKNV